jgi:DNA modification methylase
MTNWTNRIVGQGMEAPDQLLAHPGNWRIHPKHQQDALLGVLDDVGWVQNILVNRTTGHVVDGHLRVALALRHDVPEVPVMYVELSEEEESLILATLDPLSSLAVADAQKLDDLLRDVQSDDAAIQQMLADLAAANDLYLGDEPTPDPGAQIDKAEELQQKWQVQRGDLWQIGTHRLLCGDSTNADDVARVMGGEKGQMCFTDPPYGVNYTGGMKPRDQLENDHIGTEIYSKALPNLNIVLDDEAPLYLWYADAHVAAAAAAAAAAGYHIAAQIIWVKNNAQFVTSARYKGKHEPCFYAYRKGKSARWFGPNNEVTVWECDRANSNDFHPTQKPVELARRAIRNSSNSHHIVVDLFLGGGTVLVACEQTGRRGRGLEIEPKYCAVTLERLQDMGLEPVKVE